MPLPQTVFVIVKQGVYPHFVPGVFTKPELAIDRATQLAREDNERPWGGGRPDGYHDWVIYTVAVDEPGDDVHCTIGWLQKGHYDRRTAGDNVWHQPKGLSMWVGERKANVAPELKLGDDG
jgi:hypothetical protein